MFGHLNLHHHDRGCSSVVERSLCMWKARGSIPRISTYFLWPFINTAVVAEWLRRWTWKPMGFPHACSNPAGCEDQVFKGEYLKLDNIITYCYSPIIEIQIQYLLRVWLHKLASSSIISSYLHPQFLKAQFCFEMTRESRCSSSTEKRPWCLEVACGCQLVQLVMLPSLSWW